MENVVYLASCNGCNLQHVGSTSIEFDSFTAIGALMTINYIFYSV